MPSFLNGILKDRQYISNLWKMFLCPIWKTKGTVCFQMGHRNIFQRFEIYCRSFKIPFKKDGMYPTRNLCPPYSVQLCWSDYLARSHFKETKKVHLQMQLFGCYSRMQTFPARTDIAALCRICNCQESNSDKTKPKTKQVCTWWSIAKILLPRSIAQLTTE